MSSLSSDVGKFTITLESKDDKGARILNSIAEFQEGTSCRFQLEADIFEHLFIEAQLAANRAKKREQELRNGVPSE